MVDKRYKIEDIQLLHPLLKKSLKDEIKHRYFSVRSDLHYITFPDNENVFCVVSSGHFCRLDSALHAVNKILECRYFLFEDDKEKIGKYCQI